jgi:hypothetical protein
MLEAAQRSVNLIPRFVDKLLHAVLPLVLFCADDLELQRHP